MGVKGCAKIEQAGVQKIRGNDMDNFKRGLGMRGNSVMGIRGNRYGYIWQGRLGKGGG